MTTKIQAKEEHSSEFSRGGTHTSHQTEHHRLKATADT